MLERQWIVNRAGGWSIVLSGFFEPLFYLLSIRVGFGGLIGDVQDGGKSIPYAEFVAPALFAASAMNGSIYEATNVFWKLKYDKVYDAALATPLTSGDVALGEMLYATMRGTLYSVAFLITMCGARHDVVGVGGGDDRRRGADLVRLQRLRHRLVTYMRSHADFEYVPSMMLPMFLFSGTFYPVSTLRRLGLAGAAQPALPRGGGVSRPEPRRVVVDLHPPPRRARGDGPGRDLDHRPSDRHAAAQVAVRRSENRCAGRTLEACCFAPRPR